MDLECIWGATEALVQLVMISAVLSFLDCEWRAHQPWKAAQRALSDAWSLQNKAKSLHHVLLLEL